MAVESPKRRYLTIKSISEMFSISAQTIYGLISRGELPFPYIKFGHSVRFDPADVEAFVLKQKSYRSHKNGRH